MHFICTDESGDTHTQTYVHTHKHTHSYTRVLTLTRTRTIARNSYTRSCIGSTISVFCSGRLQTVRRFSVRQSAIALLQCSSKCKCKVLATLSALSSLARCQIFLSLQHKMTSHARRQCLPQCNCKVSMTYAVLPIFPRLVQSDLLCLHLCSGKIQSVRHFSFCSSPVSRTR